MSLAHNPAYDAGLEARFAIAERHSRLVRLLRIAVPAAVVLAMAAIVGVSIFNPFRMLMPKLPIDSGNLVVSGTKITMESPHLSGYTPDQRPYELWATTATQDITDPDHVELSSLRSKLLMQDQSTVTLEARTGLFDSKHQLLDLRKNIILRTTKNAPTGTTLALGNRIAVGDSASIIDMASRRNLPLRWVRADELSMAAMSLFTRASLDGASEVLAFQVAGGGAVGVTVPAGGTPSGGGASPPSGAGGTSVDPRTRFRGDVLTTLRTGANRVPARIREPLADVTVRIANAAPMAALVPADATPAVKELAKRLDDRGIRMSALLENGGTADNCGWLRDRYGVSWQIVPDALIPMMADRDEVKAARVAAAMMQMTKFDIAALKAAYEGSAG